MLQFQKQCTVICSPKFLLILSNVLHLLKSHGFAKVFIHSLDLQRLSSQITIWQNSCFSLKTLITCISFFWAFTQHFVHISVLIFIQYVNTHIPQYIEFLLKNETVSWPLCKNMKTKKRDQYEKDFSMHKNYLRSLLKIKLPSMSTTPDT